METDQKDCFDESGNKIPCSGSGQDAEHKKGGIGVKNRFKVLKDMVEDNLTGLSWCRNANLSERFEIKEISVHDRLTGLIWLKYANLTDQPVSWKEAFSAVERLNSRTIGGYSDWRLPNIRELESLTDMYSHSPALYINLPSYKVIDGYWSSTTSVYEPSYAWVLYTRDGAIGVGYKSLPKFYICAVRCGSG